METESKIILIFVNNLQLISTYENLNSTSENYKFVQSAENLHFFDFDFFESKNIKKKFLLFKEHEINNFDEKTEIQFIVIDENFITLINDNELESKINILKKKFNNIPIIVSFTKFPNIIRGEIQEKRINLLKNNVIIISDSYYKNCPYTLSIPLLSIHTFDYLFFRNDFYKAEYEKNFILNSYKNFLKREFDIIYRIGKPKSFLRKITLLLFLKRNFYNSFSSCSFSEENYLINQNVNLYDIFKNEVEKYDLLNEFTKINFLTFLSNYLETNLIIKTPVKLNIHSNCSSYSEIVMESLTSNLEVIKNYTNIISYTEKTFHPFYTYTIPLFIDIETNIKYLKNIGFRFTIEPCIIEKYDTEENIYKKIDTWLENLKNYDFKKIWEEEISNLSLQSQSNLHHNAKLVRKLMKQEFSIFGCKSIPTYLATYKLLELINKNMCLEYKNWNYQYYLFLEERKLL